jgi:hypothetical protein
MPKACRCGEAALLGRRPVAMRSMSLGRRPVAAAKPRRYAEGMSLRRSRVAMPKACRYAEGPSLLAKPTYLCHMSATTRSRVVELSAHNAQQLTVLAVLAAAFMWLLLSVGFMPAMDSFFSTFLRSDVLRSGERVVYRINENRSDDTISTGTLSTWALVESDPRRAALEALGHAPLPRAEYIFQPLVALTPLVIVGGFVLAALFTVVLPSGVGFVRQKIEREILTTLDRIAVAQFGDHTPDDIRRITREISGADVRKLHDLVDVYGMPYSDLELLQRALRWNDAPAGLQVLRVHDAVKFYMREYFTDRYANAILGLVYIGAAILIIVIGIRGLKFLPATDPSVVLGALGLEFMLLITYAVVLMYGRTDEPWHAHAAAAGDAAVTLDADSQQLLRAFLATPRSTKNGAGADA